MSSLNITQPSSTDSAYYEGGPGMTRYVFVYGLAMLSIYAILGGVSNVLLALHVQNIEFALHFGDLMAQSGLPELTALKAKIAAGAAVATADQQVLLAALAKFEAAKAGTLSMAASIGMVITMVSQPVIGVASDRTRSRFGRRGPWVVAGGVLALTGLFWLQNSAAAWSLTLAWALTSIGCNVATGPLSATIVDRVPQSKRGLVAGISGVGLLLGYVIGMAVAGTLFGRIGQNAYLPFGVVACLLCLAFVCFAPDKSSTSMRLEPVSLMGHVKSFTVALRDRDFRWVWVARVIMFFGYAVSGTFGIYMLQSYIEPGLSAEVAAKTMPLMFLVGAPGTVLSMIIAGRWSDKMGRRKPIVIGASVLLSASMAVPFFWPTLAALYIQHFIAGIAVGAYLVVDQALVIDVLPDKDAAARDLGISTLASNLGQAIGPLIAGLVLTWSGGYRMVWLAALVLVLIAAVAVIPVRKVK